MVIASNEFGCQFAEGSFDLFASETWEIISLFHSKDVGSQYWDCDAQDRALSDVSSQKPTNIRVRPPCPRAHAKMVTTTRLFRQEWRAD
jgi:hypothetical protein